MGLRAGRWTKWRIRMTKRLGAVGIATAKGDAGGGRFAWHSGPAIAMLIATLCGILIFRESALAFLAAATDGVLAAAILAAASLAGLWVVWGTGNGDLPVRWQIGLGAGFGMGALSLGMLWAGMRGFMGQTTWWVVVTAMAAAGLAALQRLSQRPERLALIAEEADASARAWQWMWLLIVPVIVLGVLAATVPPGMLWQEEANGYDVLEYHLGAPRDWFFHVDPITHAQGKIVYLDHNMYSNFPMNAEMLFLLPMVLLGSPWKAAIAAQFISLLQGALCGYAAWLIGRDYSRRVGIIAGIAGAAMPWVSYLGALAYVENGMLFYGLLAAGLCNRAIRDADERNCWRALAVGAMVGLACGYKYTVIPMIAVPLLGLWAVLSVARGRFSNAIIPVILAATMFAPWAVKNQRMTGDPVFPLGYSLFGSKVWTDAQHQQFAAAHSPLPSERAIGQRFVRLWERVIAEPRFGYVPWIVAAGAAGLLLWRRMAYRRQIAAWLAVLAVQVLVWMFATHLFARFAGVMWIPLVMLIAAVTAWATTGGRGQRPGARNSNDNSSKDTAPAEAGTPNNGNLGMAVCAAGLVAYLVVGQGWLWGEYSRHMRPSGALLPVQGAPELFFHGRLPGLDHLAFINGNEKSEKGLPSGAKMLMVGDARIYYVGRPCDYWVTFSRSPFAEAVAAAGGDAGRIVDWLGRAGYTHVYVDFGEIQRLQRTYGFAQGIDAGLFARLEGEGLHRVHEVRLHPDQPPYGIFYEVP
jgi:hypothetical protein